MATAQQKPQQQTAAATQPQSAQHVVGLLDAVIARSESAAQGVRAALSQVALIESVLPPAVRGQGQRLADRAALEFERTPALQECTPRSFVRCVVEAAELGLAVDGRLAYAVPYSNKGVREAQLQLDYKGLISVAKRGGQISDCYGDVVCENDTFINRRVNDRTEFTHERAPLGTERGKPIGAYCMVKLAPGNFRTEVMDVKQINAIRDVSKAKNAGPWSDHWEQMAIKTVIRRGLKLYCDDPGFQHACAVDDREIEGEVIHREPAKRVQSRSMAEVIAAAGQQAQPVHQAAQPAIQQHEQPQDFEPETAVAPDENQDAEPAEQDDKAGEASGGVTAIPQGALDALADCDKITEVTNVQERAPESYGFAKNADLCAEWHRQCSAKKDEIRGKRGAGKSEQKSLMDTAPNAE